MTPDELAALHPRLYHLTAPGAHRGIERHGLLSARAILDLAGVAGDERRRLLERRRPAEVTVAHPERGAFTINDNLPLTEAALERCLDDGLSPADWLRALNGRVYLWPSEERLATLLGARTNRDREREVLVFDTRSLAGAHADRVRLSPINGGSTIRKPARRGLATYAPLLAHPYPEWRRLRGRSDAIAEVAIEGSVPDAADHLIEVRRVGGAPGGQ